MARTIRDDLGNRSQVFQNDQKTKGRRARTPDGCHVVRRRTIHPDGPRST